MLWAFMAHYHMSDYNLRFCNYNGLSCLKLSLGFLEKMHSLTANAVCTTIV